jgi:acyl dehydratase
MRVFTSVDDLRRAQGSVLGSSEWLSVEQERIDRFAEATGDRQWIHIDPERAAAGPFGATIAHGYLTLSLLPYFAAQNYRIEGARMSVNYGLNKVRFISPVRAGSRLRGVTELVEVGDLDTGAQLLFRTTIELEGSRKPACVAETLSRQYF